MNYLHRLLAAASVAFFFASAALAQTSGTVTNHAFAIGKGAGQTGFTSLLCAATEIAIGQTAANPACAALSGDVTMNASGVTAIGTAKVTNAMLATMAANTTKCNATAGPASPTDCNASTMRTNIGVVIGTDVQAFDADLAALAANSTDGLWAHTGAGTGAARTLSAPAAGLTITNPAGVAGNPTFALANDLAALEGLASTGIARRTGSDAWSVGTAVANSELATMAAYTVKGNATGSSAAPTDISIPALTQKASPVAADKVMIADSAASDALKYATVSSLASAGSVSSLNGQTGALTLWSAPQGRITLSTGVAVMTSTVSGATTVYYTPSNGNIAPIYDGTNIVPTVFSEVSQTTTDTTKSPAAVAADSCYDMFAWSDAGTFRNTRGPAWTSTSARSAGTALTSINGLLLNAVSITNGPAAERGTYTGTICSNGSSTIDMIFGGSVSGGTAGYFGVWNMYNRAKSVATVIDNGANYTYTSGTFRQARASAGNQVTFTTGLSQDALTVMATTRLDTTAVSGSFGSICIGLNSTSACTSPRTFVRTVAAVINIGSMLPHYQAYPPIGRHFVSLLEASDGTNANTFNSDSNQHLTVSVWN
ncbi:hypothetical protein [Bradyrhizobium icense]|uniref:Uncharacterized protein n=1 Tax=Bradyrhizobium icense TaxID=1274631 RepID=A0A1B1UD37_9BRAD|nr:hypothetical protein [Bradyrhizobium icense]ANW00692.1 hypothetical protein LMTR13_11435 [Bradyrhizobium icense]